MASPDFTVEELTSPWRETRRLGLPGPVLGITADSRQVKPGYLFVAIPGYTVDGHQFIAEAIGRGAVAVVYQDATVVEEIPETVTAVRVPNTRRAAAEIADVFYRHPSGALTLVGVTGTNGKTTVTLMVDRIARAAGETTGVIGTLGVTLSGEERDSARTTPDAIELQALLAEMRQRGVNHVSMEVSSHGLVLDRVWGCAFDAAIFTNLTQDHLDFHADVGDYYAAKRRLFTDYADLARPEKEMVGVVNVDDPAGARLAQEARCRVVSYAWEQPAQVRGRDLQSTRRGLNLAVQFPGNETALPLRLSLLGRFNAYNALAAAAYGWARGYPAEAIREGLEGLPAVPGRFERVEAGQEFTVVVDYAHTPDALHNVIAAARDLQPRRVLCLIGCGGDRDRTKRPLMGRIATTEADLAILTSDNPRTEDPRAILEEMRAGAEGSSYQVIVDRREAIHTAVGLCQPGDLLIIAGKGHEQYQIVGDRVLPFDDRLVAREALESLL